MKDFKTLRFQTRQIHAGLTPDEPTGSRGIAIYPTSAYRFKSCDYAAKLFELSQPGNIYTRLQNPTTTAYEERIAALYGAVGALALSSGMSAILITVLSLAQAGDNIVASPFLYGGTYNQFRISLKRLGIDIRIAATESVADMEALVDDNTKAVYCESMGNPTCAVPDLQAIGDMARRKDVPFIVDNTFGAGGYLCNPFDFGANIIVDSATKWINGHGTAMGGIIVDGGNYNWDNGKFPNIAGPDEGYHGLNLYETFGNAAFIVKCRVDGLRDFGACPSAFDSYLMLLGLETLALRVQYQIDSTRRLAEFCANHPMVKRVSYVGFPEHPSHENAAKYFRDGGSAVFTIELNGDLNSTVRFVESLQLAAHMTMIGDSITVVTHPASTTHKQLSATDLEAAGVTPTLLRISVGLEDTADIIADFEQAFAKAAN
ncbi:MAG: aminotransferase class I/II-fold pyridoxal phosphate-dependent enzyme [Muribaculaceae bacterium]|nr:aminotransferase class I/II-fold pyridoxal phosphate-dependent enzyme [Muribaculaceae bacterium]